MAYSLFGEDQVISFLFYNIEEADNDQQGQAGNEDAHAINEEGNNQSINQVYCLYVRHGYQVARARGSCIKRKTIKNYVQIII